MKINIIAEKDSLIPQYARKGDAGMDLKANIKRPVTLKPFERLLVPTGIKIALKEGTEAQIRPRSGMAFKHGIVVLNTPGTIDANFRDEVKVLLINFSKEDYVIVPETKIAQMVIGEFTTVELNKVDTFTIEETKDDRGGGFGHTDADKPTKKEVVSPKVKKASKKHTKNG